MENQQVSGSAEDVITAGYASQINGEDVQFGPGFAVTVNANRNATLEKAGALAVNVGGDMQETNGGAMITNVGGSLEQTNGGAMLLNVGGNTEITNGGAMVINASGNVEITNGGGMLTAGRQVTAHNSKIGLIISGHVEMDESTTVLLDSRRAMLFGAAMGAAFALLRWLMPRR